MPSSMAGMYLTHRQKAPLIPSMLLLDSATGAGTGRCRVLSYLHLAHQSVTCPEQECSRRSYIISLALLEASQ
jgi:hypothetical protein